MRKPQSILLTIDDPCHQSWEEMSVNSQGRFCTHCSKTVIDFTAWSDAQLYQFFAKSNNVCGRFLNTQLDVPIRIPHQPYSRLYRLTIALGLTLICTQTPALLAQNRPPKVMHSSVAATAKAAKNTVPGSGTIYGQVVDEKKEPLISATVQIYQDSIMRGGSVTDYDGNYAVRPLTPGSYDMIVTFSGYDSASRKNVIVTAGDTSTVNLTINRKSAVVSWPVRRVPRQPLVNFGDASMQQFIMSHHAYEVSRMHDDAIMEWGGPLHKLTMGGPMHKLTDPPDMPASPYVYLTGKISNKRGRALANTEVQVYTGDRLAGTAISDVHGHYQLYLKCGTQYNIIASRPGYAREAIAATSLAPDKENVQDITIHKKKRH